SLQELWQELHHNLPPLAEITSLQKSLASWQTHLCSFQILPSTDSQGHQVLISPDISVCPQCLQELQDPQDRRYLYPFINCTNCGPRFSITANIPYDRNKTSMACFAMCPECNKEYQDPLDRRFHAQPNACPKCGPHCWLCSAKGELMASRNESLLLAAKQLTQGWILALKGLGGFHLACNALNPDLVQSLRKRKKRWGKPLAIMVPDLKTAQLLSDLSPQGQNWLQDISRPIVLAPKKSAFPQLEPLAPDTGLLGLMLPYTPLHEILLSHYQSLLDQESPAALVMTSGNPSGEPLCLGNREAKSRLGDIADSFLLHNRDILIRCDDTVLTQTEKVKTQIFFRRSRGFVPAPVFLARSGPSLLGLGAESKNTICLTKAKQAFISQHIGDLQNQETYSFFLQSIEHLQNILQTRPEALVADLHPDYLSSVYAREQTKLPVFRLQHHLAHIHAVLAENKHQGPVLGLALDGTGLGLDQTLWGGEFLYLDNSTGQQERLGRLRQVPLPGGEAAIAEPWRMAQSYLYALNERSPGKKEWPWLAEQEQASLVVSKMLEKKLNSPLTSSCGRLFDAVAGLLGLSTRVQYEGQAAVILENIQDHSQNTPFCCGHTRKQDLFELDTLGLFAQVYTHWQQGMSAGAISRAFHLGLAQGLADLILRLSQATQTKTVALSGGVMQNLTLFQELVLGLQSRGLHPLLHKYCPPNDACISLGQAVWARAALARGEAPSAPFM
ncbi:MAG: carbamoyltransferase HypF, partial [Desulfohalobiaceae bacterium]